MAVSGAKSGEQKVEVCRSLNSPWFFVAIRSMVWVDLSWTHHWEYYGVLNICGNGIAMPLSQLLSCFCLTLESLSARSLFFLGKTNPTVVLQHQAQKHMACFRLVPMEHLNTGCYTLLMILTQLGIPLVWHSVIWQLRSISVEFFSILGGYLQSSNSWKPGPGNKDVGSGGGVLSLQFPMAFLRRIPSSWI